MTISPPSCFLYSPEMKRGKEIKSKSAVSIAPLISLNYNNEGYIATEENAFNIILSGKKQDARCIKHVYRERLDRLYTYKNTKLVLVFGTRAFWITVSLLYIFQTLFVVKLCCLYNSFLKRKAVDLIFGTSIHG